jgi:hypothetical protein
LSNASQSWTNRTRMMMLPGWGNHVCLLNL